MKLFQQLFGSDVQTDSKTLTNRCALTSIGWFNTKKVRIKLFMQTLFSSSEIVTGALTWDELLEKRENREGLLPTRKTQLECPENYVEYDEFYCLTNFLYERYKNGKRAQIYRCKSRVNFLLLVQGKNNSTICSPSQEARCLYSQAVASLYRSLQHRKVWPIFTSFQWAIVNFRLNLFRRACAL